MKKYFIICLLTISHNLFSQEYDKLLPSKTSNLLTPIYEKLYEKYNDISELKDSKDYTYVVGDEHIYSYRIYYGDQKMMGIFRLNWVSEDSQLRKIKDKFGNPIQEGHVILVRIYNDGSKPKLIYSTPESNLGIDSCFAPKVQLAIPVDQNLPCGLKWALYTYTLVGGGRLEGAGNFIKTQMEGVSLIHDANASIIKLADATMSIYSAKGATKIIAANIEFEKAIFDMIPDDNNGLVIKTINDIALSYISAVIDGATSPQSVVASQTGKILGTINDILGAFDTIALTKKLYSVQLARKYLEAYFAYGGNFTRINTYYSLPYTNDLKVVLKALSDNTNGEAYDEDYAVLLVRETKNAIFTVNRPCLFGKCIP